MMPDAGFRSADQYILHDHSSGKLADGQLAQIWYTPNYKHPVLSDVLCAEGSEYSFNLN